MKVRKSTNKVGVSIFASLKSLDPNDTQRILTIGRMSRREIRTLDAILTRNDQIAEYLHWAWVNEVVSAPPHVLEQDPLFLSFPGTNKFISLSWLVEEDILSRRYPVLENSPFDATAKLQAMMALKKRRRRMHRAFDADSDDQVDPPASVFQTHPEVWDVGIYQGAVAVVAAADALAALRNVRQKKIDAEVMNVVLDNTTRDVVTQLEAVAMLRLVAAELGIRHAMETFDAVGILCEETMRAAARRLTPACRRLIEARHQWRYASDVVAPSAPASSS